MYCSIYRPGLNLEPTRKEYLALVAENNALVEYWESNQPLIHIEFYNGVIVPTQGEVANALADAAILLQNGKDDEATYKVIQDNLSIARAKLVELRQLKVEFEAWLKSVLEEEKKDEVNSIRLNYISTGDRCWGGCTTEDKGNMGRRQRSL